MCSFHFIVKYNLINSFPSMSHLHLCLDCFLFKEIISVFAMSADLYLFFAYDLVQRDMQSLLSLYRITISVYSIHFTHKILVSPFKVYHTTEGSMITL